MLSRLCNQKKSGFLGLDLAENMFLYPVYLEYTFFFEILDLAVTFFRFVRT